MAGGAAAFALLSLELQKPVPVSGFCVLQSPQAPSLIVTREADKVFASSSSLHHKLVGFAGFLFFFAKLREVVSFSFSRFVGF